MNTSTLSESIISRAQNASRHLVAIAGPPGAGKSTLAVDLYSAIAAAGETCCVVPMDGFHLNNNILETKGLLAKKGSPQTFDVQGFVQLVDRLAIGDNDIYIPIFDRNRDIAVAGAACIAASCKIVLVEGNYLFLNSEHWSKLSTYWQTKIFINPGIEVIEQRLKQRWLDQDHTEEQAVLRVNSNDLPNAHTVLTHSELSALTFEC